MTSFPLGPERGHPEGGYPLTLAQVHAALSYAYENGAEIQAALVEDDSVAERIQRDREEFLKKSPAK